MRFQTYGSYTFPALAALNLANPVAFPYGSIQEAEYDLQWDTFEGPSGESGIVIQGGSPHKTVKIVRWVASWSGVEIAGRLEVSANPDKPLSVLFQTAPSGTLTVPLDSAPFNIGTYGLRCDNNSVGGIFVVTAYYYVETE